jgi:PhnB protein
MEDQMKIATYVNLNGNCEEAVDYYQKLFNATLIRKTLVEDYMTDKKELVGKVFHAELLIKGFYLYFSDSLDVYDYANQAYKITMECDTLEEAETYFDTLKKGGVVNEDFMKLPWGMYMGNVRDRFDVTWDIVFC